MFKVFVQIDLIVERKFQKISKVFKHLLIMFC